MESDDLKKPAKAAKGNNNDLDMNGSEQEQQMSAAGSQQQRESQEGGLNQSESKKSALDKLIEEASQKNPKENEIHKENNEELDKAKKKLDKKAARPGKQKAKRDKREDQLLDMKKEAAIKVLKDTGKYEKNVDLVRDDSYNQKLLDQIVRVEEKIDQLDLIFTQLLSRGKYIGREQEILPWISSVLQIIVQMFHKVNLEAYRIGVLNRQLILPETQTMNLETTFEWINVCKVQYDITAKIFKLVLAFMRTYVNNSFNVVMYVNMNRIIKAEYDVNLIHKEMRTLMRKANFFRLQNVIFTKYFAHKWAESTRDQMKAMAYKPQGVNPIEEEGTTNGDNVMSGTGMPQTHLQATQGIKMPNSVQSTGQNNMNQTAT